MLIHLQGSSFSDINQDWVQMMMRRGKKRGRYTGEKDGKSGKLKSQTKRRRRWRQMVRLRARREPFTVSFLISRSSVTPVSSGSTSCSPHKNHVSFPGAARGRRPWILPFIQRGSEKFVVLQLQLKNKTKQTNVSVFLQQRRQSGIREETADFITIQISSPANK